MSPTLPEPEDIRDGMRALSSLIGQDPGHRYPPAGRPPR